MGLQETIEELKSQITEAEKEENEQKDDGVEETATPPTPEEKSTEDDGDKENEKSDEQEKKDEPKEPEKKQDEPDNSGYARLRREAKAAQEKAEREAARNAELEAALKKREEPEQEREEVTLPPALQEIINDHMLTKAEREYLSYEEQAKRQHPDYESVSSAYVIEKARQIRAMEPDLSLSQLQDRVKHDILHSASMLMQKGFENPALELYHRIKEAGYKMPEPAKQEAKEEPAQKKEPDMKKVAENRARSSGMAAASGKSEGVLTPTAAANMPVREWAKLSPAQKEAVMNRLR